MRVASEEFQLASRINVDLRNGNDSGELLHVVTKAKKPLP
jgi:hypothetical protein